MNRLYLVSHSPYCKIIQEARMTSQLATLIGLSSPHSCNASELLLPSTITVSYSGTFYGTFKVASRRSAKINFHRRCIRGLSHYELPVTEWPEKILKANEDYEGNLHVSKLNKINQRMEVIKANLQSISDGELSISAYDTAWVALVEDIHGNGAPQFPSSLEWIVNNQLPDGSWGDHYFFSPYDRLSCTLACVVALKTWHMYPDGVQKGMSFLQKNLHKLKDEDPEHMPSGYEVRFPRLLEMAKKLGLEIMKDDTVLQDLYARREVKLKRIPMEILHSVPTTLLYSLEGMPHDLDWEKLLKLQHPNGSFLCSTSATAYALMQTKDEKCLKYLTNIVSRFNGGVPHTYPTDLFERLWVVDRLERLGVSRYFKSEINDFLDYVHGYWTPNGISWSRDTVELDIDDTSMGFRMLRLHGYEVGANAFKHFEKEGQFFCFIGQMNQGVTEMLSLYRASQVLFPGENILEEAKKFASKFLREKQDLGQVVDRWIVSKDLKGEVQYALDVPWCASLPRIETRYYIDQYGGDDDVWIGKVLYRMYNVSNNLYLDLAKLDYDHCQKMHQLEWIDMERWYKEFNLKDFGLSEDSLLKAYFLAMSNIYEPDRAIERLAWAQTTALIEAVSFYFEAITIKQKRAFIQAFNNSIEHIINGRLGFKETRNELAEAILTTLSDISSKVLEVYEKEVHHSLKHAWNTWLHNWQDKHLIPNNEAELLVNTINLCAGHSLSLDLVSQPEYMHLTSLTNNICSRLRQQTQNSNIKEEQAIMNKPTESVELEMQKLVQHVIKRNNNEIAQDIKQTFLTVAKSYNYIAHCDPTIIDLHISKVIFDTVL